MTQHSILVTGNISTEEYRHIVFLPWTAGFSRRWTAGTWRKRRSFYAELIKRSDETRNLDMVLNAASTILGNSVLFSDMNFKIVSHSTTIPVNDPLWKENVERGFCSYEFIAAVRQLEAVQKAARTTDAIEVSCTESPYRKLSSKGRRRLRRHIWRL